MLSQVIHVYFINIYGRYPSTKETLYFQKFFENNSKEELFNEIVNVFEIKKNVSMHISKTDLARYFQKIESRINKQIIHTSMKTFEGLKETSQLHTIKKTWEDTFDCVVYRYNDTKCRELIHDNFDTRTLNAYDKVIPGAFKSDIWRLCTLFILGGVYSDIHIRPNILAKNCDVLNTADYIFCIDTPSDPTYIYNALMKIPRGSVLIEKVLDKIIHNIENELYPDRDLEVSGPGVIGKVLLEYLDIPRFHEGFLEKNNELFLFLTHQGYSDQQKFEFHITLDRTSLFFCRYNGYREEINEVCKSEHYSKLFKNREIYNH